MTRDELIESELKAVYAIAREVNARLPSHVEMQELIADGLHGLVVAAENFDPSREVAFNSYARFRIRGFILDGLRRRDVVSRRANWDPDDVRLQPAVRLDKPMVEGGAGTVGELIPDSTDDMAAFEGRELVDWLLGRLPVLERTIVTTLAWGDISESELAERRGVTPSRISQIYQAGLHHMRLDLYRCGLSTARTNALARDRIRRGARKRRLTKIEHTVLFSGTA